MKKLLVSAFALAMMSTGAIAGEQLTTSQLDQVTAGFFDTQDNANRTTQVAIAAARGSNLCAIAVCTAGAVATAANSNVTGQANVD